MSASLKDSRGPLSLTIEGGRRGIAGGGCAPRPIHPSRGRADRAYRVMATGAGLLTLVMLFLIGLFLVIRALPAFHLMGLAFLTTTGWQPDGVHHRFGIAAIMYWTVVISVIALAIALPLPVAGPLFL